MLCLVHHAIKQAKVHVLVLFRSIIPNVVLFVLEELFLALNDLIVSDLAHLLDQGSHDLDVVATDGKVQWCLICLILQVLLR